MRTLSLLAAASLLAACGGSSPEPAPTPEPAAPAAPAPEAEAKAEPAPEAEPEPEAQAENRLVIEATDQMKYNVSTLNAVAGKEITLELKHVGKLDKAIMGHNWVLLKMGTDVQAFAMAAIDAKDTGYIPGDHKDKVVANTKVLGGGESDTITFTVAEPGTYTFICSFPGHSAMMKGELVVAAAPAEGSAG